MGLTLTRTELRTTALAALLAGLLCFLVMSVLAGAHMRSSALLVALVSLAVIVGPISIGWPKLMAGLILVIIFIPIRKYSLPVNLPFELEPYRLFVMFLVLVWVASLLADHRTRLRKTGFEGPLALIAVAAVGSIVSNPERVGQLSGEVNKRLMFFFSFFLVLYIVAGVSRRLKDIDFLVKTLVVGGGIVAALAVVEARTGFNAFNHLWRVLPLTPTVNLSEPALTRFGVGKLRVFGSAQHPIALGAALVMLTPLAVYLAVQTRQKRWLLCALALFLAVSSTVSRTAILMLVVAGLVFVWLRPREMKRMWPAIIPALIVMKIALPGTLGALKQSFIPAGGLVAEQQSGAGQSGSGRLADLGPGLQEWARDPLFGQGFGTRVVNAADLAGPAANILDNQWLGTLLELGAVGFFGWIWLFVAVVRTFGKEAKRDQSARGWLLASLAAGVAAFSVGMFTYDAFYFIQVTFLLFIFIGLGSALLARGAAPVEARPRSRRGRLAVAPPATAARARTA